MQCSVQTDICICDEIEYLFLVQEACKRLGNTDDPELSFSDELWLTQPQLIAEAIAAYQRNNFVRDKVLHLPALGDIAFPGITLVGTSPTFYRIKVTTDLNDAVTGGTFPANTTIIYRRTLQLPLCNNEGMRPLENRTTIIQYYQAFKTFV